MLQAVVWSTDILWKRSVKHLDGKPALAGPVVAVPIQKLWPAN